MYFCFALHFVAQLCFGRLSPHPPMCHHSHRKGQFIAEVTDIMRMDPWDEDLSLPWKKIKAVWDGYWDHQKTYLLEKSPPHFDPHPTNYSTFQSGFIYHHGTESLCSL